MIDQDGAFYPLFEGVCASLMHARVQFGCDQVCVRLGYKSVKTSLSKSLHTHRPAFWDPPFHLESWIMLTAYLNTILASSAIESVMLIARRDGVACFQYIQGVPSLVASQSAQEACLWTRNYVQFTGKRRVSRRHQRFETHLYPRIRADVEALLAPVAVGGRKTLTSTGSMHQQIHYRMMMRHTDLLQGLVAQTDPHTTVIIDLVRWEASGAIIVLFSRQPRAPFPRFTDFGGYLLINL